MKGNEGRTKGLWEGFKFIGAVYGKNKSVCGKNESVYGKTSIYTLE